MRRLVLTALCASVLALLGPHAAPGQEPTKDDAPRYNRMPWHLVDLWWDIGEDTPFERYSIDVTISDDLPAGSNLYLAPVGLGHLGATQFYGGIQTQIDGNTRQDPMLRKLGPGFLFSMWGERSLDAIRPSIGGYCQSSGHEGDFVSVRRPYEWHKGTYTFSVVRMDQEQVEGAPHTWVGVFARSHEKDENVFVGALRFPGRDLVLGRKLASFVEVYGQRIPVEEIPKFVVTFGNLAVNGQPAKVVSAEAVYPKGVPDYAQAVADGPQVVVTIGEPVEGRTKRSESLISADAARP